MFANKGKGFSILSHIYAYLHLGLELQREKENHIYLSILFQSLIFPNKDSHRNHICLPAAIR